MNSAISLCPVPLPLRKNEVTSGLCLEAASLKQQVAVCPMGSFSGGIDTGKRPGPYEKVKITPPAFYAILEKDLR